MEPMSTADISNVCPFVDEVAIAHLLKHLDVKTQACVSTLCKNFLQVSLNPIFSFGQLSATRKMAVMKPDVCALYSSLDKSEIVFHSANKNYILFSQGEKGLQCIERQSGKIKLIDIGTFEENKTQSLGKQTLAAATLSSPQNIMTVSQQGTIALWEIGKENIVCKKQIQTMNREGINDNQRLLQSRALFGTNAIFVRRGNEDRSDTVESWDFDQGLRLTETRSHWGDGFKLHAVHSNNFYDTYFDQQGHCFLRKMQINREKMVIDTEQTQFQKSGLPAAVMCANEKWVVTAHRTSGQTGFCTVTDAKNRTVHATIEVPSPIWNAIGSPLCWLFDDLFVYGDGISVNLFYIPTQRLLSSILLEKDAIEELETTRKPALLNIEIDDDSICMLLRHTQENGSQLQKVAYKRAGEEKPEATAFAKRTATALDCKYTFEDTTKDRDERIKAFQSVIESEVDLTNPAAAQALQAMKTNLEKALTQIQMEEPDLFSIIIEIKIQALKNILEKLQVASTSTNQ
ncbi:MAG: hypothetical protein JSR46_03880 [Verrucomicrobia bacterium]|nr:hypothetical protein [Verrucomicrobiota bacterium]